MSVSTVLCEDGAIRLVGGASFNEGRVEVCWCEEWRSVCDVGWSGYDASVVCGQLGLSTLGE